MDGGFNTYLYANANPVRFVDPLGLFACPGGVFNTISFPSVSAFFGGGLSISDTTFTCESNGKKCEGTAICFGGGPLVAGGLGGERGRVTGVTNSDNLGDFSSGLTISGGPVSITITGNSASTGLFKSIGFGAAFVSCTVINLRCDADGCN